MKYMNQVVVGLDLARAVGVAVLPTWDQEEGIRSWTKQFDQKPQSVLFRAWVLYLVELQIETQADCIAWEELETNPRYMSKDWMRIYFGMRALLLEHCERMEISYVPITVGQVKKFATGNGNAKKEEVFNAAVDFWPDNPPETHNDADARYIALLAADILEKQGG